MRIDQCKALAALKVLKRHVLQERRFARPGLSDDIQVQKPVFVLYAEDALVAAKIDAGETSEMMCATTSAFLR